MSHQTTIYIFGNPLLEFDSLPLKLTPRLKKSWPEFNFTIADPNENLKPINQELIIIDTVIDIQQVTLFNDLNKIQLNKIYSLHDFDLAFNLKLLQKLGQLSKVTIFGLPPHLNQHKALKQLNQLIARALKAN